MPNEPPRSAWNAAHGSAPGPAPSINDLLNEGLANHRAGQLQAAARLYERALQLEPDHADALNLLGIIVAQEGRREMAAALLTRAAAVRPKDASILNNLGRVLFELFRFEDAREPLERAVALQRDYGEAQYNLGAVLRQLGQADRALALWRNVVVLNPKHLPARLGIAEILLEQGDFAQCEQKARELLAEAPHLGAAHLYLARARKATDAAALAPIEAQIEAAAANGRVDPLLHYAAGKVSDDLRRYDRAFQHFSAANQKSYQSYDHAATEQAHRRKKEVFTEAFYRERAGWGFASPLPVFVVGMPRSGTTLTEQILAAHPDVFGAGEITAMESAARFSEDISATTEALPQSALHLSRFGAELVGRRYIDALRGYPDEPARRIVNKTPHNFEHLGLIALTLPGAKIIHCRRNPLDTCVSCWTTSFAETHAYNRSLPDLARYYLSYRDLMEHWRSALPITILDVDYEDYASDLEATARRIVDFIGLEWDARCLDFHSAAGAVRSPSAWQVRQPIYASSIGRWRHYMPYVQPLIDALGPLGREAAT